MEGNIIDTFNPMKLSLDEMIALTALHNKETESESYINYQDQSEETVMKDVDQRLRETPGFGSKPIHQRLGYRNRNSFQNNHMRRNMMKYRLSQKSVFKARNTLFRSHLKEQRSSMNPTITFTNPQAFRPPFVQPLTVNSVNTFNRINNVPVCRVNGSNRSVSSAGAMQHRHSIRKCLDPMIQRALANLKPSTSINMAVLNSFKPVPEKTDMSTSDRFSFYN